MPEEPRRMISNTTPLVYLHRIRLLHLLRDLYGAVWIPGEVATELRQGLLEEADVPHVFDYPWIEVHDTREATWLARMPDLGAGEAGVMALALAERTPCTVIVDDQLGRQIARALGLQVTGTAGVLVKAKKVGMIPQVRPCLQALVLAGFYLRAQVIDMVCAEAGE